MWEERFPLRIFQPRQRSGRDSPQVSKQPLSVVKPCHQIESCRSLINFLLLIFFVHKFTSDEDVVSITGKGSVLCVSDTRKSSFSSLRKPFFTVPVFSVKIHTDTFHFHCPSWLVRVLMAESKFKSEMRSDKGEMRKVSQKEFEPLQQLKMSITRRRAVRGSATSIARLPQFCMTTLLL